MDYCFYDNSKGVLRDEECAVSNNRYIVDNSNITLSSKLSSPAIKLVDDVIHGIGSVYWKKMSNGWEAVEKHAMLELTLVTDHCFYENSKAVMRDEDCAVSNNRYIVDNSNITLSTKLSLPAIKLVEDVVHAIGSVYWTKMSNGWEAVEKHAMLEINSCYGPLLLRELEGSAEGRRLCSVEQQIYRGQF